MYHHTAWPYTEVKNSGTVHVSALSEEDQSLYPPTLPSASQGPNIPLISKTVDNKPFDGAATEDTWEYKALRKRDAKLKFRIRVLKFGLRFLNFVFAAYTTATMSITLSIFLNTNQIRRTVPNPPSAPITRGPWHANSQNWPTYVLLAASIISCVSTTVVVLLYFHSVKLANKVNLRYTQMVYVLFAAHAAVWIGTAISYRIGKTGSDLWGWSCTSEAQDVLQPYFEDAVDFNLLCAIQTSSWAVSLAQAACISLNFVWYWAAYRRFLLKRRMDPNLPVQVQFEEEVALAKKLRRPALRQVFGWMPTLAQVTS